MAKTILFSKLNYSVALSLLILNLVSCKTDNKTVADVMDDKMSYLYKTMDSNELVSLDYDKVFSLFSDDEKEVLATQHLTFDVNIPVVISVIRSLEQKIITFRLPAKGSTEEFNSVAEKHVMDDCVFMNDRSVNRYTAKLRNLKSGTKYECLIVPLTIWNEEQLAVSDAEWKFAMFHFPPYSSYGGYPEIREKLCTLFDRYHVDMVMSGYVHNYLRTKPRNDEKPVSSPSAGTIYLISIGIPDNDPQTKLAFTESQVSGEML
jgi:hypothetical protein